MADRLQDVFEGAAALQDAVTIFRRMPVNDARLVRMASDDVDVCLKALLADVSRLCGGFY